MSRHVLITGASSGIGLALCKRFKDKGWSVTGFDVDPPALQVSGYAHERLDVCDEAVMTTAFERTSRRAPLTAVIANAAVTDVQQHGVADLDYALWQRVMRVNVDGAFLTGKLGARHMNRGGNIVFVTSSLAFFAGAKANVAPYCTSKSAVEMFMRVLALELADRDINVNTLFPSVMVDTGFFAHLDDEERAGLARPDLLNGAAMFLAELEPGTVTGVSLDQQRWDTSRAYRSEILEKIHGQRKALS
jgi:NAD(P)-dependent dehydrogenase (short-subunit alcohol dehydrogenase family)